ncbi:hypothetical protein EON82_01780 [bacterium]|nr:MAG: hypothetical protein EON82_01780 [bacterium]
MAQTIRPKRGAAQRLQSIPKPILYLVLVLATSVPLFFDIAVPNEPVPESKAFYDNLMTLKEGDRVLIASDWTNSTRGESSGEFDALMRILMRKGVKFAIYSTGDAQSPQVARNEINVISKLEKDAGRREYVPFNDYVILGYFPNSEGTLVGINNNVRATFQGKKDFPPNSPPRDVLQSPVFQGVKSVADFKYLLVVTASKTSEITIERIKKTPLMFMVTGVMVPETRNYYTSGQITGLVGGVKGVYDLETLMKDGFPGMESKGKGTAYYLSLHFALGLLIFTVILGNVAMFLAGKRAR